MHASGARLREVSAMSVMLLFSYHVVEEGALARIGGHEHILLK